MFLVILKVCHLLSSLNKKHIFHKICSQEWVITAPLPAGMNTENLQLFTCTLLKHFITISWKKRELQSMDNVQVKYLSNLLPSDIHRQQVNDFF